MFGIAVWLSYLAKEQLGVCFFTRQQYAAVTHMNRLEQQPGYSSDESDRQ